MKKCIRNSCIRSSSVMHLTSYNFLVEPRIISWYSNQPYKFGMVINLSEMPTGRGVEIPLGNDAGGAGGAGGAGVAEVRVEVRRGREFCLLGLRE
jgi:hypothetical protein